MVVAEGHGLIPELVAPVLSSEQQAVWLLPTEGFKRESMERRNKPSFRGETSDPERATQNVFARDMLLADHVQAQAQARGLTAYVVDGSRSAEEMAALIGQHFEPHLRGVSYPNRTGAQGREMPHRIPPQNRGTE
jgi:hypothetical protein